ncbi:MAG: extracellular solute-binding protein [Spirochaetales bacterium]|nr:extracellular solute-binding protein [Spirochaetales bacterium]
MATIKDVAALAGVSTGTVSNYLNKTKPVSPETAQKIADAIKQCAYKPNYLAKNLRTKQYNDVGVLLPNFEDNYYIKVLQGIEVVFRDTPYTINLSLSHERKDYEISCIESFARKQICGLIVFTSIPGEWKKYYDTFINRGIPLVLIDRKMEGLESSFVMSDNYATILKITRELTLNGERNLWLLTGPQEYFCESECIRGFENGLAQGEEGKIITSLLTKEDAFRAIVGLSDELREEPPTAIITTSENKAKGIIESLKFLGYCQREIPVITLGEENWNQMTGSMAALATSRPAIKIGSTAASILIEEIENPVLESKNIFFSDSIARENLKNYPLFSAPKGQVVHSSEPLNVLMLDTIQTHALKKIVDNFKETYGIEAKITVVNHQNLLDRIMEEGNSDVIMYDMPWLQTLIQNGLLADLTEFTKESNRYQELFLPRTAELFGQWREKVYGFPFMYALQILYYRKDLFENSENRSRYRRRYRSELLPPTTWKEFNTIAQFFTQNCDSVEWGTSFPAAYPECLAPEIYLRLLSFERNNLIINSSINLFLNNQNVLKAYVAILRLLKYVKPDYRHANDESVVKDFFNGKTAMVITYPPFFNKVALQTNQVIKEEDIGYSEIPGGIPILGGWGLGINSKSSRIEDAYKFIKWACMDNISSYFSVLGGFSAVQKTYQNDELAKLYPWFPLYSAAHRVAKPIVPPLNRQGTVIPQNSVDDIICDRFYEILERETEVHEAIKNTQSDLASLTQG